MAEPDPYDIIIHPYVTEKTLFLMERENKIEFIVRRTANKDEIKKAIEKMFEVKVDKINTKITKKGKKAMIKFSRDYKADEIGMRIGVF